MKHLDVTAASRALTVFELAVDNVILLRLEAANKP